MPIPARGRRRSCWRRWLTPPRRQHRPAFTGLRMVSHGWPFADSARDMDIAGCRIFSGLLHAFRLADDLARCPASKPRHFVPRLGNVGHTSGSVTEGRETSSGQVQQYVPGFTEPTLVLVPRTKYRHGSASVRCLTRHFSPAPFTAALRCEDYAGCSRSFRRSQIAETVMDSSGHSR
jgi:hypothetical protein